MHFTKHNLTFCFRFNNTSLSKFGVVGTSYGYKTTAMGRIRTTGDGGNYVYLLL